MLRDVPSAVSAPPSSPVTTPEENAASSPRITRRPPAAARWYRRIDPWKAAPIVVALLFTIAYLIWQPRTVDLAAHTFRADLFGVYTDPKYSVVYPNGDQVQTFTIAFLVHEWTGTPRPDGDEVDAVAFFPLDALPEPLYEIHRETIDDFRRSGGKPVVK